MFNAQKPDPSELPSTGRLLKSTGIAAAVAGAMLVFVVLPAEYGVDPTGAGSLLGLTEMGRIKMQLAEEAALDQAEITASSAAASTPSPEPVPSEQAWVHSACAVCSRDGHTLDAIRFRAAVGNGGCK
jgi:hypothetical protein